MAAQYHFLSEFTFRGDREAIWAALQDVGAWPGWWKGLNRIEVVRPATAGDGTGAIYRNFVRAPSGYSFVYDTEIVAVEAGRRIDVRSTGEIDGDGRFVLGDQPDGVTYLSFAWLVVTPKRWMSLLAPIARPAFTWNHDRLMAAFGTGLASSSGTTLLTVANAARKPGSPGFFVMPPA